MKKFSLVEYSVERPKLVVAVTILITIAFMTQMPKIRLDTNPKNMLPATSDVRVWNDEVQKTFNLNEDIIVLGIINEQGIVNTNTLNRIKDITGEILKLKGIAAVDVSSFTTIDNIYVEDGVLKIAPLMTDVPNTNEGLEHLKKTLAENPLFINRIISQDGKTAGIYIPLEKGANGKEIADKIREIIAKGKGDEKFYITGDPVVSDTFVDSIFKLLAIFAPGAMLIMFIVRYLMFKDLFLSIVLMMDAMIAVMWSMGLFIGLGCTIHIMSSMAPVFLMAIATDSMHIFNEFYFRYRELGDKKQAIIKTMKAVSKPVRNTALATAAGFSMLLLMNVIPIRVFGVIVAFGTIALRVLSFTFIPAMFTFVKEENLRKIARAEKEDTGAMAGFLRGLASLGINKPAMTVVIGLIFAVAAIFGITRLVVNNNFVEWFKKDSEVRTADRIINKALGGTSPGYIVATAKEDDYIKTPEAMRYIEGLQKRLETLPVVGKTSSVVDYVKRINLVLHDDDPKFDVIPQTTEQIGQYLFLFSMSAKPSDLDNVLDYPFRRANIFLQLKTWNTQAMREVIQAVQEYTAANPTPMTIRPAGMAYFNLVWNDDILLDMLKGFVLALLVVFAILVYNFKSLKWALVGYTPLLFTILLIYGVVGFIGKDFDMPVSVLSCLLLGMSVDFAIHFIDRFNEKYAGNPNLTEALLWTAARPGKGIMRNALLFVSAFSVMLFAPLTPYMMTGVFIVSMMTLSCLLSIIYLPALIVLMKGQLLKTGGIQ